jgi:pSer/pThr/pTyr-binding forkhead associated (FHA) protein
MARLVFKSQGFPDQAIELKLGVNRFGRTPGNDVQIEHLTISSRHCEVVLGDGSIFVRDCGSTNGTFVDGEPAADTPLAAGQTLRLGDVELLVENTDVRVAIPKFDLPVPAPPVVLTDGSIICPRHASALATHQCTYCREVMCDECVHHLRRRGGRVLKLCPICSHRCEVIGGERKRKKTFLSFFQKTVRLPFLNGPKKPSQ